MSIFTFINTWNNFLIALILLFDPKKFTLPIMIAFISLSKKIVGGLTVGGVNM